MVTGILPSSYFYRLIKKIQPLILQYNSSNFVNLKDKVKIKLFCTRKVNSKKNIASKDKIFSWIKIRIINFL